MPQPPRGPALGLGAKLNYGLGSIAQGVAVQALAAAIIAYYLNQVVGLPADLVGTLIMLSVIVDAVVDPLIGRWSDNFRSRWGRRHPFMYASAPLTGISFYFLWHPPAGLSVGGLASFMLALLVIVRLCISLYDLPSTALAPELAPDYHERTSLLAYRWLFFILGGGVMTIILYSVFLRTDASHPLGLLNREGYGQFGAFAALVMFVSILASTLATHRYIPLLRAAPQRRRSFGEALREVAVTLSNRSLLVVMVSGLLGGIVIGMNGSLGGYMYLHFWGLKPQLISLIVLIALPASLVGIVLAPILSRRLDKKWTMVSVFAVSGFTGAAPTALRLVGWLPANGSPWLVPILSADAFVAGTLGLIGFIIVSSMIADVAEDAAVKTGVRSEGLLFATNSLLPKLTNGVGSFVAGLMLTAVRFPDAAKQGTVDPQIMRHLALLSLPVGFGLSMIGTAVLIFYRIDRKSHERNLETLADAAALADLGHEPQAAASALSLPCPI
jgi:GPH family glycoside/pentoside/hexuronide:cation symporter